MNIFVLSEFFRQRRIFLASFPAGTASRASTISRNFLKPFFDCLPR
jgi:hypothetical protein